MTQAVPLSAIPRLAAAPWPRAALVLTLLAASAAGRAPAADRRDAVGDPLPAGALARFGWARLHHGTWIKSLEFSPTGRLLASCGGQYNQPGDVALWDVETGRLVRSLAGAKQGMAMLAFSPGGETLAAAGLDRTIRFWDTATGKSTTRYKVGSVRGNWIAFAFDEKTIAVSDGANVYIVDGATGKKLHTIAKASQCVFSPDGKTFATTSMRDLKAAAQTHRLGDFKLIRTMSNSGQRFTTPAYSPDAHLLAAGCIYGTDRGSVMVWDTATGKVKSKLTGHNNYVNWVTFSPRGDILACASQTTGVYLWDVKTGKKLRELSLPGGRVYAATFSPDGELLAVGGMDGQIRVWDVNTWKEKYTEKGHRGRVVAVAASADGQRVLTGGQDGTVRLWEGASGKQLRRLSDDGVGVLAVAVSPDGATLAAGGATGAVQIWDTDGGTLRHTVKADAAPSTWLAFTPDGKSLLAFGTNGAVREIDAGTGKAVLLQAGGKSAVAPVAVSADGRVAASLTQGLLSAWEPRAGKKAGVFSVSGISHFYAIALDRTGRLLAGDAGQRLALIELDSGKLVRQITVANRRAGNNMIAFSPDGRTFAASEADGTITLWSVRTGDALATRKGHRGQVTAMTFLPDGKRLLTGSADGTAIMWSLPTPKPPAGGKADPNGVEPLWGQLASSDAGQAQDAIFRLVDAGQQAVTLLAERLESVRRPAREDMRKRIAELGDRTFAVRVRATNELARLGAVAEPALRQALSESSNEEIRARAQQLLEALDDPHRRSGETVRQLRAVYVLEQIASDEAVAVLGKLAGGSPRATLTRRAAVALERLQEQGR